MRLMLPLCPFLQRRKLKNREVSDGISKKSFGQSKPPIDLRSIDVNLIRELWSKKFLLNSSWSPSFKKFLWIDDKPKNLREQKQHLPKIHFFAWTRMLKPSALGEVLWLPFRWSVSMGLIRR